MRLFLFAIALMWACGMDAQVFPNQFTLATAPDSSNFEVYSQKNGVPRRANLWSLKEYFERDSAYLSGLSLIFTGVDQQTVALDTFMQDLSLDGTELTLSGSNTIDLFGIVSSGLTSVTSNARLTGLGTAASPLDIATGGVGTTYIADNAVTLAKMATMATSSLLGRSSAGTGNVETISVGSGLSLSGGTLSVTSTSTTNVYEAQIASTAYYAVLVYTGTTAPTITNATIGSYTITIPLGTILHSMSWNDPTGSTFVDVNGDIRFNFVWTSTAFNDDYTNAHIPNVAIMDTSTGVQRNPQGTGYQIVHSIPNGGIQRTVVTGINGLGPWLLKFNF